MPPAKKKAVTRKKKAVIRKKKASTKKRANAKQATPVVWADPACGAIIALNTFDGKDGRKALSAALKGIAVGRDAHRASDEVAAALAALPIEPAWLASVRKIAPPALWAIRKIAPGWGGEEEAIAAHSFADLAKLPSLEELEFIGNRDQRAKDIDIALLLEHPTLQRVQLPGEVRWTKAFKKAGWVAETSGGRHGWSVFVRSASPDAKVAAKAVELVHKKLPVNTFKSGVGGFEIVLQEVRLLDGDLRATFWFTHWTKSGAIKKPKPELRKRSSRYSFARDSVRIMKAAQLASPKALTTLKARVEALQDYVERHRVKPTDDDW